MFFFEFLFCDIVKCLLINLIALKPQHEMYENIKSLFANPILFLLTIVLTNDAFCDYFNFAKIEAISSLQNKSLHYFKIQKNALNIIFSNCIYWWNHEKILDIQSFNNCTIQLNYRAKYVKNIDIHDIKIEIFVKANNKNNQNQEFFQWNVLILTKITIILLSKK